jgi:hypothetical protein
VWRWLTLGGRFGDAIHIGMDLAANMPPELIEIIDEGWELGKQQELIERFHKVFRALLSDMGSS